MLAELRKVCADRTRLIFNEYLNNIPIADLRSAMEYSLLNSGKLIRPLLVYAASSIFSAPLENADLPAAGIEMIHTYSLIHDDLPSMDNADLRRGKPTCHKIYGDAMAILAGDALQALAFEVIVSHPAPLSANKRTHMVSILARAAGPFGMVGGQVLDITANIDSILSEQQIRDTHQLKTGALISAALELGRLCSDDDVEQHKYLLQEYGDCIGLAFQIQDDILDIEKSAEELGKTSGIDEQNHKQTYVHLHGLEAAKLAVAELHKKALAASEQLGPNAQILKDIAALLLKRQY